MFLYTSFVVAGMPLVVSSIDVLDRRTREINVCQVKEFSCIEELCQATSEVADRRELMDRPPHSCLVRGSDW